MFVEMTTTSLTLLNNRKVNFLLKKVMKSNLFLLSLTYVKEVEY